MTRMMVMMIAMVKIIMVVRYQGQDESCYHDCDGLHTVHDQNHY